MPNKTKKPVTMKRGGGEEKGAGGEGRRGRGGRKKRRRGRKRG